MEKLAYYWKRLRENRLAYNLVLIGAIILAMAVTAHIVMQVGTRHGARRTVPDFSGIKLDEAQRTARKYDLKLHINDSLFVPAYEGGIVLDQLPEGGVEVKPGRTVYINLAIVRIYMYFNIFYLRHDRNRCRRCMNTSAGFCRWDSLNAMHTAFIF